MINHFFIVIYYVRFSFAYASLRKYYNNLRGKPSTVIPRTPPASRPAFSQNTFRFT